MEEGTEDKEESGDCCSGKIEEGGQGEDKVGIVGGEEVGSVETGRKGSEKM